VSDTDDIPKRLREQSVGDYSVSLWDEAADAHDRLRAEVAALKADLIAEQGYRAAAEEIAQRRGEMVDALTAEVAALKAAAKPLAERKVVQLIVLPQEGQTSNELYALCDDGTIWQRYEPQGWTQRLGIPQPEQRALLAELAQRTADRDEARRKICHSEAIDRLHDAHPNEPISRCASIRIANEIAVDRGWDCFEKEAKP